MSDNKNGQLSMFLVLIIGVLLLSVVLVLTVQGPLSFGKEPNVLTTRDSNTQLLEDAISQCIEQEIDVILTVFGIQGGVLKGTASAAGLTLPVETYLDHGTAQVPRAGTLEERFSPAVERVIRSCAKKEYLPGYEIEEQGLVEATTIFSDDKTTVKLQYPLIIRGTGFEHSITSFEFQYPARIQHYLSIAERIVSEVQQLPAWFDVLSLGRYDVGVAIEPVSDQTFLITLQDVVNQETGQTYEFKFTIVHEETRGQNNAPTFFDLDREFTVPFGQQRIVDVNAVDPDGDAMYYSVDNDQFSINVNNGLLETAPGIEQGVHTVTVTADDGKGMWVEQVVTVTVT